MNKRMNKQNHNQNAPTSVRKRSLRKLAYPAAR